MFKVINNNTRLTDFIPVLHFMFKVFDKDKRKRGTGFYMIGKV